MRTRCVAVLASLLGASAFVGCIDFSAWMRRHTYPPEFQYITREQLSTAMWQLAQHVDELDRIMKGPAPIDEHRRREIVQHLNAMERATGALGVEGWRSNHPLVDANLEMFRRDIVLAREAVEAYPPNYFMVGVLYGACVYCHGGTRGTR